MTQPSRTTESISRDNAGIREIMHQIRDLTVPDRATLAVGLVGHLATMMNRSQMTKLLDELREQVERVQDVPPVRQHDLDARVAGQGGAPAAGAPSRGARGGRGAGRDGRMVDPVRGGDDVGQGGRGEFRARELL
jgi:hypothetical protein